MTKGEVPVEWLAGFLDGDGCIVIHRHMHQPGGSSIVHTLWVQITQKKKGILREIQKSWGGKISRDNWYLVGPPASTFLETVEPYLRCKHVEARLGIDFEELRVKTHSHPLTLEGVAQRDAYYWALREAKNEDYALR